MGKRRGRRPWRGGTGEIASERSGGRGRWRREEQEQVAMGGHERERWKGGSKNRSLKMDPTNGSHISVEEDGRGMLVFFGTLATLDGQLIVPRHQKVVNV